MAGDSQAVRMVSWPTHYNRPFHIWYHSDQSKLKFFYFTKGDIYIYLHPQVTPFVNVFVPSRDPVIRYTIFESEKHFQTRYTMVFVLLFLARSPEIPDFKAWKRAIFSTLEYMESVPNRGDWSVLKPISHDPTNVTRHKGRNITCLHFRVPKINQGRLCVPITM